jgi:hypothetical protein
MQDTTVFDVLYLVPICGIASHFAAKIAATRARLGVGTQPLST